jgi:hypothetical protein
MPKLAQTKALVISATSSSLAYDFDPNVPE